VESGIVKGRRRVMERGREGDREKEKEGVRELGGAERGPVQR
jgi:hypothetical protein